MEKEPIAEGWAKTVAEKVRQDRHEGSTHSLTCHCQAVK